MERNIQKNGLVNLVVAVLIFLAGFGVTVFAGSLAGQVTAIFLGLGIIVAGISWFQMRLEENERLEKLELDELARSRGQSLFESKDGGSFPAQNARLQFEKYFVPGFAVLILLLEAGGKNTAGLKETNATAALSLFAIFALVLFLIGRFSVTIARLENHRLLRPGASFLLAGAYVCALTALGITFIFTMIGEEFGLVGGLAVLGLLTLIMLGAMAIALRCRHQYGRLLALGIAMNFFMYVFVNIAMVMGVIPVGGVPLPLISHGGSAMFTVMIGFGLLMSVHVHRDVEFGQERDAA